MAQPVQSSSSSIPPQHPVQQYASSNAASVPSKRPREASPNDNGSSGPRQSTAIHRGTSKLMDLLHQEQASLAAIYEDKIRVLSRKIKATQEQVDYLTQVAVDGNDLLSTRIDFQKKLDDAQRLIQEQKEANLQIIEVVRRNGMELVSEGDSLRQKVDLRFNDHTREVISKFFHLPETNSPHPSLLSISKHDGLTPLKFFTLLQDAVAQGQQPEGGDSTIPHNTPDGGHEDADMHPPSTDTPTESTTT